MLPCLKNGHKHICVFKFLSTYVHDVICPLKAGTCLIIKKKKYEAYHVEKIAKI